MGADMLIAVAAAPVLADGTPVLDVEVISRCASAAFQSAATAGQVDPEAYWDIVDADTPTVAEIAAALDGWIRDGGLFGRDVTVITVEGRMFVASGGLSWSDAPTDAFSYLCLLDEIGAFTEPISS